MGRLTLPEAIAAAVAGDDAVVLADLQERLAATLDRDRSLGSRVYLELGPSAALSKALRSIAPAAASVEVITFGDDGLALVLEALTARTATSTLETWPLSHGQRRWRMLHQQGEVPGLGTMGAAIVIDGDLNRVALEQAFRRLVDRHEILRTRFEVVDGERDSGCCPLETSIRAGLASSTVSSTRTRRHASAHGGRRPFDSEHGPLIRVRLATLAAGSHLLSVNMHHIVSDGWSLGVLVRELEARLANHALEPLSVQYRDYAVRQQQQLENGEHDRHREFWIRQLTAAPRLNLAADRRRPSSSSYPGGEIVLPLDPAVTSRFAAVCQREGVSLFTGLVAGVKALLFRYTGQHDITVGTPVAGRDESVLESQIGFYVNTLALRDRVAASDRFVELLRRVRTTLVDAYEHQAYPFDRVVQDLDLAGDPGRHPLFDVLVDMADADQASLVIPGCRVRTRKADVELTKFDLSFTFERNGDAMVLRIGYSADLDDRIRIERLAGHAHNLLRGFGANADQAISDVPLMDDEQERRLLETFNLTEPLEADDATLVALFERQASSTPEAPALTFGDRTWSYRELDRRATALAMALSGGGVGCDDAVAILMERSEGSVIAMLGALKAGAAYLPIEAGDPDIRINAMIQDAGCRVVISTKAHAARVQRVAVVDIDEFSAREGVLPKPDPDHLAYVIFTSGSTGRPNGVMVSHRSAVALVRGLWKRLDQAAAPRAVAVVASFAFDASVQQIFPALLRGDHLHVIDEETKRSPERLWNYFDCHRIDVADCTPAVLVAMLEGLGRRVPRLSTLIVGGDALPRSLVRESCDRAPATTVVNAYGPTETRVDATLHRVDAGEPEFAPVSIGRPLPESLLYILDAQLQPVPVGVPGDLYIGGAKLARGYAGNPRLTAARFGPSPFLEGARIYKTGDAARWRDDGSIEFLGRTDHQVKIRGYRVETGEVEAALRRIDTVGDAIVLAAGPADRQALVAYVRGDAIDVDAVKDRAAVRATGVHAAKPLYRRSAVSAQCERKDLSACTARSAD